MSKIAVIGGGASGIKAAITAKRCGADVILLEKNKRVAKKILVTGNGRCNFTNVNADKDCYNSDFAEAALAKLPPESVISFFEEIGMLSLVEREGRVYPKSMQASCVCDVLRFEMERLGVSVITEFEAANIQKNESGFCITSKNNKRVMADKVIISTGGMAAPSTGSDGFGFEALKKFGHTVTPLKPSLSWVKTDKGVQGVRQRGRVSLKNGVSQEGEIQFAKDALSGIPVFCISKYINPGDSIFLDLVCEKSENELIKFLKGKKSGILENYLVGVVNKALGQVLLKDLKISPLSREVKTLTDKEITKIASTLKNWEFKVTALAPWENAQVTSGGITLSEINEETMESRKAPGIYITGELLDIDSYCGGYNLQWAWSSGFVAGREASGV